MDAAIEQIVERFVRWVSPNPTAPWEAFKAELRADLTAYGEQCRRAGAEERRAIVCEEWQAFAMRKGVTAEALVASILNRFDALPSAAEAASPAAGWRLIFSAPYEDDITVLLWTGIAELGARDGADWYDQTGSRIEGATHWMPIDSPSEEARAG